MSPLRAIAFWLCFIFAWFNIYYNRDPNAFIAAMLIINAMYEIERKRSK